MNPNLMQFFQGQGGQPPMMPNIPQGQRGGPAVGPSFEGPYMDPAAGVGGPGYYQGPYAGPDGSFQGPYGGGSDALLAGGMEGPPQGGGQPLPIPRGQAPGQGAPLPIPRGQAPGQGAPLPIPRDVGQRVWPKSQAVPNERIAPNETGDGSEIDEERKRKLIEAIMMASQRMRGRY